MNRLRSLVMPPFPSYQGLNMVARVVSMKLWSRCVCWRISFQELEYNLLMKSRQYGWNSRATITENTSATLIRNYNQNLNEITSMCGDTWAILEHSALMKSSAYIYLIKCVIKGIGMNRFPIKWTYTFKHSSNAQRRTVGVATAPWDT